MAITAKLRKAFLLTVLWLGAVGIIIPSLANIWMGRSSLVRFDPTVSTDYNCIFVEGHSQRSFAVPWMVRSTPIKHLRIRYTPIAGDQPYGIMFVEPNTLAFEAHSGFAKQPTQLSGRLDSPAIVGEWMRSQPRSVQASSHERDAQEIFDAIIHLSKRDLEHFTVPFDLSLSNFRLGHTSPANRDLPSWPLILLVLIPIWLPALRRTR